MKILRPKNPNSSINYRGEEYTFDENCISEIPDEVARELLEGDIFKLAPDLGKSDIVSPESNSVVSSTDKAENEEGEEKPTGKGSKGRK